MEELGSSPVLAKCMKDVGYADNYIDETLDARHVNVCQKNGCLSDNAKLSLSSGPGKSEKENIDHDVNMSTGNSKTDVPEELLMPAIDVQQRENEAANKRVTQFGITDNGKSHSEVNQQANITIEEQEQSEVNFDGRNPRGSKGMGLSSKHCSIQAKLQKTSTSVRKGESSSSQIQKSKHPQSVGTLIKGTSKGGVKGASDTSSKQKKTILEKSPVEVTGAEVHGTCTSVPCTVNVGGARSNHTVPQPFSLSTGKRASNGSRHDSTGSTSRQANMSSTFSSVTKDTQLAAKSVLRSTTKLSCSGNSNTVTLVKAYRSRVACSASSYGFVSRCDERAEKRKEFFSKLDEKLHAKEAEINQLQAKTKEEKEAAIKELRKSLTFKATPMPSFYHEAAPPKIELKKIPPTRAKSPKLGRRKSGSGADSEENPIELCRTPPFILEHGKINKSVQTLSYSANSDNSSDKDRVAGGKSMHKSVTKLPSEKTVKTESKERHPSVERDILNMPGTESTNGSIENGKSTVIWESDNSSASSNNDHRLKTEQYETVLKLKEFDPSRMQNEMAGEIIEDDILRESDSLIDNVEDFCHGLMASDEELHACYVPNIM
ncbi:hypothetical protein KI387_016793 [Taxus chinensis]|uniref:TPX2 C-terminal domain-containing protein n=1 Tax=Taxus chinensis TaxID=29808 RepID=A0AA38GHW8_TAXCH|nr:hypothetical protein KI387_016793 [Taxus chinensis]